MVILASQPCPPPCKKHTNNDPCLREVGRKLCSCCHFTRIKRITLPVGRIDSGHRSLPHLKNAWVNPQTEEPLQVIQRQSTREWLALAMQTSQTQLLQRQQSLGITWALGW